MKVQVEETTLGEKFLLKRSKSKIVIPIYQRGYDWDASNINDLWQDILDHIPGGKYADENHFFGFIWALKKEEEFQPGRSSWEIIDGQQRIVSCILILVAIRDYCQSRLESQKNFDNLSYTYLNYECSNCKKKTHYFKDAFDKNGNIIKREHESDDYLDQGNESGKNHAWVTCDSCSATMDLENQFDDKGNKLNSITRLDGVGDELKRPKALYLKSKHEKKFKDAEGNVVEFPNLHTPGSYSKCYDDATINNIKRVDEILYLFDTELQKPSIVPVITLGLINNEFFEELILKKLTTDYKINKMKSKKNELTDTTNKICEAYKEIIKLLSKFFDKKTTTNDFKIDRDGCRKFYLSLDSIIECILNQLTYHLVPVEDEFDAYRKFDTINNRGVGLANQDLIKTCIFSNLYEKLKREKSLYSKQALIKKLDDYERKWTEIRERINPKDKSDYSLEKFLHHLIVIKYGNGTERMGDIFVSISDLLSSKRNDAETLIKEIDEWSKIFQKIRTPQRIDWNGNDMPEIEWYLNTIRQYQSEICYHIILASYEKHWIGEKPNKKLFAKIVELSHRNFVRNKTIGKVSQNEIESLYKKIAKEIMNDQDFNVYKMQSMLLNDSKSSYVPDSKIEASLNVKNDWYKSKLTKYFLEEISNSMGTGYSPESTIQVEHIMPINFNDDWKNHLTKKKNISEDDAEKLHETYLNELGNLTLISKELNASIKDALFKIKLGSADGETQCYLKEQSYGITSNLGYYQKNKEEEPAWTDVQITDRAKKLMKKILEILDINTIDIPHNFTYENENASGDTRADWYDCLD